MSPTTGTPVSPKPGERHAGDPSVTLDAVAVHRSYKVRFNSVSSYSDARKSSSDGPDSRDNFESTGPLANVR